MKIWRCPKCDDGVRAPQRMRSDNVLAYCLACSKKTGKLVKRVCPSREADRARREEERKRQEAQAKEKHAARTAAHAHSERGQLEAKIREWTRLDAFKNAPAWSRYRPVLSYTVRLGQGRTKKFLRRQEENNPDGTPKSVTYTEETWSRPRQTFTSGHAYGRDRIVITVGTDQADALATILHEIAHCASGGGHGSAWMDTFAAAVEEVTGEKPTGTTKRTLHDSSAECVRRWLARNQLRAGTEVIIVEADGTPH